MAPKAKIPQLVCSVCGASGPDSDFKAKRNSSKLDVLYIKLAHPKVLKLRITGGASGECLSDFTAAAS